MDGLFGEKFNGGEGGEGQQKLTELSSFREDQEMAAGEEISRSRGEYFSPLNKHVELRQKNGREETKKTKNSYENNPSFG